jgi:hypothetical protein
LWVKKSVKWFIDTLQIGMELSVAGIILILSRWTNMTLSDTLKKNLLNSWQAYIFSCCILSTAFKDFSVAEVKAGST